MIIVLGQFEMAAGHRDEFMRRVADLTRSSRSEPGCLEYAFLTDPIDQNRIILIERWTSEDMFNVHLEAVGETAAGLPFNDVYAASGWTIRYQVTGNSPPRPFDA
jgi:quinol monooxygenase YgiN